MALHVQVARSNKFEFYRDCLHLEKEVKDNNHQ